MELEILVDQLNCQPEHCAASKALTITTTGTVKQGCMVDLATACLGTVLKLCLLARKYQGAYR